ncbi:MAG: WecB/TagA/CpsF family glycosyltransferase [Nostoc desertorum CM1-VF14]|nr:WecB/TagA/CpsF family glycosyltransferase [Nostoc desertorum CM1-VF14]
MNFPEEGNKDQLTTHKTHNLQTYLHAQTLNNQALKDRKILKLRIPIVNIIGSPITALPLNAQIKTILEWASNYESKVVCVANVHMLVEAYLCSEFSLVLKNADLVAPDGMPLIWMMKLMGVHRQDRVAGMDIILSLSQLAPQRNVNVFFLGSQEVILQKIKVKLEQEFPHLKIAGMEPLPFRPLTPTEDEVIIQKINASGAGVVLVSLGCPKQEYWMDQHKEKIKAVMIGLGGAFPVFVGIHRRAPFWMRNLGLEWFYRLIQEPQRLWLRYWNTIPLFLWLALRQLLNSVFSIRRVRIQVERRQSPNDRNQNR